MLINVETIDINSTIKNRMVFSGNKKIKNIGKINAIIDIRRMGFKTDEI